MNTNRNLTATEVLQRFNESVTVSTVNNDANARELYQYLQEAAAVSPDKILVVESPIINLMIRLYVNYVPPSKS